MENKTELNLKKIGKLFTSNTELNEIPENERKGYVSNNNTIMIIPKLQEVKNQIIDNFKVTEQEPITLDYENSTGNTGKYSTELLSVLASLHKSKGESVEITMAQDMPIKIETYEFILILAPRIDY